MAQAAPLDFSGKCWRPEARTSRGPGAPEEENLTNFGWSGSSGWPRFGSATFRFLWLPRDGASASTVAFAHCPRTRPLWEWSLYNSVIEFSGPPKFLFKRR